jgi:hypothetical protein
VPRSVRLRNKTYPKGIPKFARRAPTLLRRQPPARSSAGSRNPSKEKGPGSKTCPATAEPEHYYCSRSRPVSETGALFQGRADRLGDGRKEICDCSADAKNQKQAEDKFDLENLARLIL